MKHYILRMEKLWDSISTLLGLNWDSSSDFEPLDRDNENFDSVVLGYDDKNLQCEKQIIQCQITNERLLGSTSASLRKKYGNDVVNRAIQRLSQRRKRGKCSRKAELMKLEKMFKPVIETYLKKKNDDLSNNGL